MAPAFDPPAEVVKATRARPLTGLMPTAWGAKESGLPFRSADGKLSKALTTGTLRSTTASVAFALLATSARLRILSTATDVGPVATLQGPEADPMDPVQSEGVTAMLVARFTSVMSFEPWLATTATPVAVLIATEDGDVPTGIAEPIGVGAEVGC